VKRVTVTRLDGHKVVGIRIPDGPVFELTVFNDAEDADDVYERYLYVAAWNADEAKRLGRPRLNEYEILVSVRAIEPGEAAVHVMHDGEIIGWSK
jgi:hypothetical protein